ncbi:MAG: aminotransferase class I/II-fold pyridoxal phosphate-dependent enzyme [Planctomycetes bacterium]|jgi:8-amino-7-oxononanoate synthase|nr:aminotransferase class I/II-fold pyridoxal phosphate-dependent enzyme [Planctomycetota bacterium]
MADWPGRLRRHLDQLRADHQHRRLRPFDRCAAVVRTADGRALVNFASNDYLGLAGDPALGRAAADLARTVGAGAGAARLVSGHLAVHEALEQRWARFKGAEAALLLPTGYMANLAALTALASSGDVICLDKLCHASLIDAARHTGAIVRVFPHGNLDKLARLLERSRRGDRTAGRRLIVTDSVFSMDGDCADLGRLCDLRDRHDAILIVDEAHATGVLGPRGAGLAEHLGLSDRIDLSIATASKALGSLGGIIAASRLVIDTIVNSARSFIYTTATPPMVAAAIDAALDVVEAEPERRARVAALAQRLRERLRAGDWAAGWAESWAVPDDPVPMTPIVPLVVGDAAGALDLADHLDRHGVLAPAIRPPTVAPGAARLRLSVRADHRDEHIEQLVAALARYGRS